MRFRTLEIRWHDSKPISTCDFQPISFKKARYAAGSERNYATQSYRLATGGEDNHVRLWMVHPNLRPTGLGDSDGPVTARPPRVEYLSTLSRHSAAVNVTRFSPNGELIASAGDDGMIIVWAPSNGPQATTYGSDISADDVQFEKEFWKPRTTFRCTTMQVYDLAWSPTGEYVIAGSTDNAARVFSVSDGKCVHEIAEHNHYVQGVAWDPLNEYIATQSSDRSMHIYKISDKNGNFEAHAVGKNTRMQHRHSRTPSSHDRSSSRPRNVRRESLASEAESTFSEVHKESRDDLTNPLTLQTAGPSMSTKEATPLTPATSVMSTPSSMFPPSASMERSSSRRSSFSGSNAPGSPSTFSRYGRSPSPMPPLPAIRPMASPSNWTTIKLYGDESFTNFFRRLTFSTDGGLLLTPAGQFEDPSVIPTTDDSSKPRGRPATTAKDATSASSSCVYVYSRANFARPPVAQLPGHKKASVAVKFSPILYELRRGVIGPDSSTATKEVAIEKETEGTIDVNMLGSQPSTVDASPSNSASHSRRQSQSSGIVAPIPQLPSGSSAVSDNRPLTPAASKPATPTPSAQGPPLPTSSVFALPYRMLYAVITMDAIAIYDTQQTSPLCLLTKLHYDEFTDVTWSPDGQCLILCSRDGYCTLIMFDDIIPAHHTQQHALQLQSIAHNNSMPVTVAHSTQATPMSTPSTSQSKLPPVGTQPNLKKRSEPPLTPATSIDGDASGFVFPLGPSSSSESQFTDPGSTTASDGAEPPKKKRRVALTHVGGLDS